MTGKDGADVILNPVHEEYSTRGKCSEKRLWYSQTGRLYLMAANRTEYKTGKLADYVKAIRHELKILDGVESLRDIPVADRDTVRDPFLRRMWAYGLLEGANAGKMFDEARKRGEIEDRAVLAQRATEELKKFDEEDKEAFQPSEQFKTEEDLMAYEANLFKALGVHIPKKETQADLASGRAALEAPECRGAPTDDAWWSETDMLAHHDGRAIRGGREAGSCESLFRIYDVVLRERGVCVGQHQTVGHGLKCDVSDLLLRGLSPDGATIPGWSEDYIHLRQQVPTEGGASGDRPGPWMSLDEQAQIFDWLRLKEQVGGEAGAGSSGGQGAAASSASAGDGGSSSGGGAVASSASAGADGSSSGGGAAASSASAGAGGSSSGGGSAASSVSAGAGGSASGEGAAASSVSARSAKSSSMFLDA